MRNIKSWLALLCLQGLAFGAAAQDAYVVGSLGRASWDFDCGTNGCQRGTNAWRVGAGYRFNRVLALEAFHFDFGRARSSDYALDGTLGGAALGVQALVGWQFDVLDFAGKIGLARVRSEFRAAPTSGYESTTVHKGELMGGLMAAWRVTPGLAVRLDVDIVTLALNGDSLYFSRGSNVTTLLLGVAYRF